MRAAIPLLLFAACAPPPAGAWRHVGAAMGTTYAVQAPRLPAGVDGGALRAEVDALVLAVDASMSTWKPESELSRFGASASTDWFDVSEETALVVAEALRIAAASGGAFDPTVGPLVELWGFGASGRRAAGELPSEQELATARADVGWELVEVRREPPALRKRRGGIALDLSALAKGYAVDLVAEHLEARGVDDFLVELGGELRARGRNTDGSPWRVAIEAPGAALLRTRAARVLPLADAAVATSGGARNGYEVAGQRYAHVLDPRTGRPVESAVASVSVVASTALRADALATALFVLGPDDGLALAAREGAAALFLLHAEGGLLERATPGFPEIGGEP